jgi:glycerophosphoryl diester phosphodiesterase
MKLALNYPVTTLEMDVVISKDLQVVVSHEPWMSEEICLDEKGHSLQGKKINLYRLTAGEIRTYDCGTKAHPRFALQKKVVEHKPLLKDLLSELEAIKKSHYSIEIKSTIEEERDGFQPEYKKFSDLVMKEVLRILPLKRVMIQSFDWRVLTYLHGVYPELRLVALRETAYTPEGVLAELGFSPAVFSPDWTLLTAMDVAFFHQKKISVIPWTVNSVEAIHKMIAMGVDGIITDYPNLISEIPKESYEFSSACQSGYNRFERKCVKIPRHAQPSAQNPGWVCGPHYQQKRNGCVKIQLPKHALFSEDGKTWICRPGYKRYRYRCQKSR